MKPRYQRILSSALCLSLFANVAAAQVGFSRACRFSDIPQLLKSPFLLLTNLIGEAPWGQFDSLLNSESEQRKHWILESITADYFQLRYALYAENRVYVLLCPNGVFPLPSGQGCNYTVEASYMSQGANGWVAQTLSNVVLGDSRLSIFFNNRQFLYSARAGHPNLITRQPVDLYIPYTVVGQHFFYNNFGAKIFVEKTVATTCNLSEWGFGTR